MIREKNYLRSGNFILSRANWHFKEKSGEIEVILRDIYNKIEGWKNHFGLLSVISVNEVFLNEERNLLKIHHS